MFDFGFWIFPSKPRNLDHKIDSLIGKVYEKLTLPFVLSIVKITRTGSAVPKSKI